MKQFIRKLTKTATHSYVVTLPKELVQKYGWRGRQKLTIVDEGRGKLKVKDWKRR